MDKNSAYQFVVYLQMLTLQIIVLIHRDEGKLFMHVCSKN